MADTHIEWSDRVWNPTTGCDKISPGCGLPRPGSDDEATGHTGGCYALTMAKRLKSMGQPKYQRDGDPRTSGPGFGLTVHENALTLPLRWRKPSRIFVNSMSDLFHAQVPDEFIAKVFAVMARTPQHTYQLLTKRHGRMRSLLNSDAFVGRVRREVDVLRVRQEIDAMGEELIVPIADYPGYLVSNRGDIYTTRGSGICVWCSGSIEESAGASRTYCSKQCRHNAGYYQRTGRWSMPSEIKRKMRPDRGQQGHLRVMLYRDGQCYRELVHRLVLAAFGRPSAEGEQVCHIDGDPTNNALPNLRWGTQSDNMQDRSRHGRGRTNTKLTTEQVAEIRQRCTAGESYHRVARHFNVSDTQVRNIAVHAQWTPVKYDDFIWPLPGVWVGVSCEDQHWADIRIPALLQTPAAVRWISAEPLLGPIDLTNIDWDGTTGLEVLRHWPNSIRWVVVGGESGPGARPMKESWVRCLVNDCRAADTAVFVKQMGSVWSRDIAIGGKTVAALGDPKGDQPKYWPEDLQVRQYPELARAVGA